MESGLPENDSDPFRRLRHTECAYCFGIEQLIPARSLIHLPVLMRTCWNLRGDPHATTQMLGIHQLDCPFLRTDLQGWKCVFIRFAEPRVDESRTDGRFPGQQVHDPCFATEYSVQLLIVEVSGINHIV